MSLFAFLQYCHCVATKTFRVFRAPSGFLYFHVIAPSPPTCGQTFFENLIAREVTHYIFPEGAYITQ